MCSQQMTPPTRPTLVGTTGRLSVGGRGEPNAAGALVALLHDQTTRSAAVGMSLRCFPAEVRDERGSGREQARANPRGCPARRR